METEPAQEKFAPDPDNLPAEPTPSDSEPDPEPVRSAETLFRNMYRVHVEVSALADTKANFLISVNSIVMILATAHGASIVTDKWLLLPSAIIVASCIGSMIFAVLVARPRITDKTKMKTQPEGKPDTPPNLLFFGSFTHVPKEIYMEGVQKIITDPHAVYPAMMSDVYDMGLVMTKKFARLKIAYGFMLYGMPTGIVLFLIMQTVIRLSGSE